MERRAGEKAAKEYSVLSTRISVRHRMYCALGARYSIRLLATLLLAIPFAAAGAEENVASNVGVEGVYYLRWKGSALEAAPVDDDAAIVLRIAGVSRDGDDALYELRYIGSRAGEHDLQKSLRRVDGQPLTGMPPIRVSVRNLLPESHDGELEDRAVAGVARAWRYRLLLAAAALLWTVPLAWLIGRRIVRRRTEQVEPGEEPPRTLADQLRPLVEAALVGRLSTLQQAQLERMLIAYWRERLDLAGCPIGEALARMRRHPPSAALLGKLDEWLHQPPRQQTIDVAEILRPYRDQAPLDSAQIDSAQIDSAQIDSAQIDSPLAEEAAP